MSKRALARAVRQAMCLAGGVVCLPFIEPVLAQDGENVEEVLVYGVRQSLENAVEVKRNATAVVDHISADDIVGFPALDLGETLQALPGIQLNRDSERRQSEVSMRGFSGGFILQTVAGQEFANPTRSQSQTAPNPFGAFESSVFNGVTVYKSQQADLVEGGIAGVIDKKLPDALSKKESEVGVTIGTRYEQLNDSFDPEFNISGNLTLIEDRLAIAGKLAGSKQSFREDFIVTPQWSDIGNRFVTPDPAQFANYQAWKDQYGIFTSTPGSGEVNDLVMVPNQARQITEYSEGQRLSFTGNIGFQATDALKLTADVLYTKRDMDKNEFENLIVNVNGGTSRVTPLAEPRLVLRKGALNDEGEVENKNHWIIPAIGYENGSIDIGNREFDFLEQSRGVFLGAEWENGPLSIESNLTFSKAENDFVQVLLSSVLQNAPTVAGVPGNNGVNGVLAIDGTNTDGFQLTLANVDDYQFLGDGFTYGTYVNGELQPLAPNTTRVNANETFNGATVRFGVGANSQTVDRDMRTFDLAGTYELESPWIKSVKAGLRFSEDELVSTFRSHTLEDTAIDLLSNDLYEYPYSGQSKPFFNGKLVNAVAPASAGNADGWLSLNVDKTIAVLQSRGITPDPALDQQLTAAGFIASSVASGGQASQNFDSEQSTQAIFMMANLEQDLGFALLTGNVGIRHIATEVDATGFEINTGAGNSVVSQVPVTVSNRYSHTLPSLNLAFELNDEFIIRFAASRALTRPNLKGLTPATVVQYRSEDGGADNYVRVTLPDANVEPFTSDGADLVFEWYNRPGSNVAIGFFNKTFKGKFETLDLCPPTYTIPGQSLTLNVNAEGVCEIQNPFNYGFGGATGDQLINELRLQQDINSDQTEVFVGSELSATQNFDFLPAPWDGFGFNASFTHLDNRDDADAFNVSDKSFNLTSYWENEVFSARLSTNYRSDYRLGGGGSAQGREERIVKSRTQYDLTLSYQVIEDMRLTFQAFNLTDVRLEEHDYRSADMLRRVKYVGRTYALKASYQF